MVKRKQLSWLWNGTNSSLLAWSARPLTIMHLAPQRQLGAPAQSRSDEASVGTR
jgi:hypothetical protein